MAARPRRRQVEHPVNGQELTADELRTVRTLADAADAGVHLEERSGIPSVAVIRSLSRATGYQHQTCALAVLRGDVAALFGAPPLQQEMRAQVTGDVRTIQPDETR